MSMFGLIVQLVGGALGGNLAGAILKKLSLGAVGDSIVGILGGGIGGQVLGLFGMGGGDPFDIGTMVSNVAGGGVGGAALLVIVGGIRQWLGKS